jgi:ElaB/YqjD/DUF883 family membrane-anchored ribosome-binding protein
VKPSAPADAPKTTAPAPADAAPKDQVPGTVAAQGTAKASVSLLDGPADPPAKKGVAADEIRNGSNGPHNAFGPVGHETRDSYSLGMKDGFYRLGFDRQRISGESHVGLLANTKGGGFDAGFMTRTPFGQHFSIAWGAQMQATMQKQGETTLVQLNPDILTQARYQTENHRFTLNAGLYNRIGVGWNPGAVSRNAQALKDLEDKVKKEFDSLKQKAGERLGQLKEAGQTFLNSVKSALPQARDQFAQLAAQRVQEQMPDVAGQITQVLGSAVNNAFTSYMNNISGAVGQMQQAMQDAANASSPSQMQAAFSRLATAMGQLQAATAAGSLNPYITQMEQEIGSQLGPEMQAQMAKLGQILEATATEVGSSLLQSVQSSANTAIGTAQRILTELLGDGANALQNTADAADAANQKREQMTTVAASGRLGVGLDYQWRMPFLSSNKHDFNTVLDVGGSYYHPLYEAAWADKGAPNPLVVGAATGPQADWHAGLRFTKWFGNVGVGANAGYRGTYTQGAGVSHAPEFGVSLSSSF